MSSFYAIKTFLLTKKPIHTSFMTSWHHKNFRLRIAFLQGTEGLLVHISDQFCHLLFLEKLHKVAYLVDVTTILARALRKAQIVLN